MFSFTFLLLRAIVWDVLALVLHGKYVCMRGGIKEDGEWNVDVLELWPTSQGYQLTNQ